MRTGGLAAPTYMEFFCGGGMARAGLGPSWRCLFANDIDPIKVKAYRENWGAEHVRAADVATLSAADLPTVRSDLVWASFPCQDLSLAGGNRGLGAATDVFPTRSGTFWPFWRLIRELARQGRPPRAIALENVHGCLTSHGGRDFAAIASALAEERYRFGALVVDAALFVPQSRPRVFFIAVAEGETLGDLVADAPSPAWTPPALLQAYAGLAPEAKRRWVWWRLNAPPPRTLAFADVIEAEPTGVAWRSRRETDYLLSLMTDLNAAKVAAAQRAGGPRVGAVYRRTRADPSGVKRQRAEVRFDDLAGCLRTPAGGSSRQTILLVDGPRVRSRLLSPREAARLMGLPDSYKLPENYNDAYHLCGDGVCAPAVRHLAANLLEPILARAPILAHAAE